MTKTHEWEKRFDLIRTMDDGTAWIDRKQVKAFIQSEKDASLEEAAKAVEARMSDRVNARYFTELIRALKIIIGMTDEARTEANFKDTHDLVISPMAPSYCRRCNKSGYELREFPCKV
jgi:hypothetical protein